MQTLQTIYENISTGALQTMSTGHNQEGGADDKSCQACEDKRGVIADLSVEVYKLRRSNETLRASENDFAHVMRRAEALCPTDSAQWKVARDMLSGIAAEYERRNKTGTVLVHPVFQRILDDFEGRS